MVLEVHGKEDLILEALPGDHPEVLGKMDLLQELRGKVVLLQGVHGTVALLLRGILGQEDLLGVLGKVVLLK